MSANISATNCADAGDKMVVKLIIPGPDGLKETDPLPIMPEQIRRMRAEIFADMTGEAIQDKNIDGVDSVQITNRGGMVDNG
jgi:hypothetical protein